ncbi:hypothetical protein TD95_002150 [Thielaviopsis punctulata]|uniref:UFSP1/2/DUB catalytic domain-containing protein n=1 Tax=Thielaviopsis punctulata TaxID=72032 RepID=A0A0F4Z647_9PEZI|nr:hypothetical protein TD95_002150 [Thielaviopsis punctulata]
MQAQKEKWLDRLDRERKRDQQRRREKEQEQQKEKEKDKETERKKTLLLHSKEKVRPGGHSSNMDEREEPTAMILMRHLFSGRSASKSLARPLHKSKGTSSSSRKDASKSAGDVGSGSTEEESDDDIKRLGVSNLGLFAYEKKMPGWLHSLLERKEVVALQGMIGELGWHLNHSRSTSYAYLCHPGVQQVFKLRREGHFCGYRTIQAMSSFINATNFPGVEALGGRFPTIFEIQDIVESAWDVGINSHARTETGGIKGTRKYIGTSEAEALFKMIGTPCSVQAFRSSSRTKAAQSLLNWVLEYFMARTADTTSKVRQTELPPIYLQTPAHSMMVVGIEHETSGDLNLIVFDPKFYDVQQTSRLATKHTNSSTVELLQNYRRGMGYLSRHSQFEILEFRVN